MDVFAPARFVGSVWPTWCDVASVMGHIVALRAIAKGKELELFPYVHFLLKEETPHK
jgi:hypothetical protein